MPGVPQFPAAPPTQTVAPWPGADTPRHRAAPRVLVSKIQLAHLRELLDAYKEETTNAVLHKDFLENSREAIEEMTWLQGATRFVNWLEYLKEGEEVISPDGE